MRVFGEFSPLLRSYWFSIKSKKAITNVQVTPVPEGLFVNIDGRILKIRTIVPVISTADTLVRTTSEGAYIRLSCNLEENHFEDIFKSPDPQEKITHIKCLSCNYPLISDIENSYILPTINLEVLTELWSCHPSHEQTFDLMFKENICYESTFFYIFNPAIPGLKILEKKIYCPSCEQMIGTIIESQIHLYKHKVLANLRSPVNFIDLVKDSLIDLIHTSETEVHIGDLSLKLLKWNSFVYMDSEYKPALFLNYSIPESPNFIFLEEDVSTLRNLLQTNTGYLPEELREFSNRIYSFIV